MSRLEINLWLQEALSERLRAHVISEVERELQKRLSERGYSNAKIFVNPEEPEWSYPTIDVRYWLSVTDEKGRGIPLYDDFISSNKRTFSFTLAEVLSLASKDPSEGSPLP